MNRFANIAVAAFLAAVSYGMAEYNYLLFHTGAEMFSIVVMSSAFAVGWNSRGHNKNRYVLLISLTLLPIAVVDSLHAIAYKGLGVFPADDANLPTQLWIAARYMTAGAFLAAPTLMTKKIRPGWVLGASFLVAIMLLSLIFTGYFPTCFIEGAGLTPFKIISEYIICTALGAAIFLLYTQKSHFTLYSFSCLVGALLFLIMGELAFTFYIDVYGLSNFFGHLVKILSFYMIYLAIVRTGVTNPYEHFSSTLKEKERRYRALFDSSPLGIVLVDPQTRYIIEFNTRFGTMISTALGNQPFLKIRDLAPPSVRQKTIDTLLKHVSGEEKFSKSVALNNNLDEIFYANISSAHLELEGEHRVVIFFEDITEKIESEEAKRESEERFRALHNASFGGIAIHDQGFILDCNMGLAEITGYELDELRGMDGLLLIAEQSRQLVINNIKSGYEDPYEAVGLRKDGTTFPVRLEARNIPYKGKDARAVEFRDITEQKETERALKESEARFRLLYMDAPVPYQSLDQNGNFLEVNRQFCNTLGYEPSELIGRNFSEILHPEWRDHFAENFPRFKAVGEVLGVEFQLRRKDGEYILVSFTGRINRTPQGDFRQTHCVFRDITQERASEKSLIQAKEAAESANRSKSEFLANMSHEIRTPLNGVLGLLQLLQETPLNEEQKTYADMAVQSSARLTQLLSDILDLSRVEAGKMTIENMEFNLSNSLEQSVDLFKPVAQQANLSLEYECDPNMPSTVVGDPTRLQQVLANLIGNAIKFTSEGRVTVKASLLPATHYDKTRVLFSVADTGIGISDSKLNKLFVPFTQASEGFSRQFQGAGLGLSICKRLVHLMGGNIAVESEEGKGTTVLFSLPYEIETPAAPKTQEVQPDTPPAPKLKVLIAEDDDISQITARTLLGKQGYHVTVVDNGSDALDTLQNEKFDLILMDVQMPVMDGVETTRAIRDGKGGDKNADVPIIAMTAYAMAGDRDIFLNAGMNGYVSKPIVFESLLSEIRTHMRPAV